MLNATVLFVSSEPSLAGAAEEVSRSIPHLNLDVCAQIENARSLLDGNEVALAVIHLPEGADEAELHPLLQAACEQGIAAVVLSDRYDNQQAFSLLRAGAADYVALPLATAKKRRRRKGKEGGKRKGEEK